MLRSGQIAVGPRGIADRLDAESLAAQTVMRVCLQAGDLGSIPVLGRSSGEGNGDPLQYSCLEDPMNMGSRRVGHDCRLHFHLSLFMTTWEASQSAVLWKNWVPGRMRFPSAKMCR